MARIAGVDIPPQKRVVISLTYIHGIGDTTAQKVLKMANLDPEKRTKDLSDEEVARLRQVIDRLATNKDILIEGDLRRLLPRPAAPPGPARARPAHPHQRPQPARTQARGGR